VAILEDIALSVEKGDEASVGELTQKAVSEGIAPAEISLVKNSRTTKCSFRKCSYPRGR